MYLLPSQSRESVVLRNPLAETPGDDERAQREPSLASWRTWSSSVNPPFPAQFIGAAVRVLNPDVRAGLHLHSWGFMGACDRRKSLRLTKRAPLKPSLSVMAASAACSNPQEFAHTLRFFARGFLALTKKSWFLEVPIKHHSRPGCV